MIKSILLAVDGSVYTDSVLKHGIDWAKKLDAHLRVVSVVDVRIYEWVLNTGGEGYMPVIPSNVFHDESFKFHNERAESMLTTVSDKIKKENISCTTEKVEGSPVETLCEMSRQVDLIIMGARGDYARWGDRMLGATLESVSRQSHSPLMIVDQHYATFNQITCAYDRSDGSSHALKLAAYLGGVLKFPVEVVNINEDEEERKATLEEAKRYLEPYQLDVQYRHEAGDAAEILIQLTKETETARSKMLIMGSYGHSRIREAIIGSTTVQVMRSAAKPIIVAR
jgi:nucleotide-binding universal stress UspA family protein